MEIFIVLIVITFMGLFMVMSMPITIDDDLPEVEDTKPNIAPAE